MKRARAMIRAHLRRFLGGASAAPSETSPRTQCEPQDVAGLGARRPRRASRSLRGRSPRSKWDTERSPERFLIRYWPSTWECSTSERRLCRRNESWGEASEGGRSPPPNVSGVGALGCTLNVQRVRLACSHQAPP